MRRLQSIQELVEYVSRLRDRVHDHGLYREAVAPPADLRFRDQVPDRFRRLYGGYAIGRRQHEDEFVFSQRPRKNFGIEAVAQRLGGSTQKGKGRLNAVAGAKFIQFKNANPDQTNPDEIAPCQPCTRSTRRSSADGTERRLARPGIHTWAAGRRFIADGECLFEQNHGAGDHIDIFEDGSGAYTHRDAMAAFVP